MSKQDAAYTKIGTGHASAMGRQGLRELRASLYPESNVAQQGEYGLYGTRTPGEVSESRRAEELDMDEEHVHGSVVEDRLRQAEMSVELEEDQIRESEPEREE